jgi:hypothetical protein
MGLRLNFGVGPLRANVPLTGKRRRAAPVRTVTTPNPFVKISGEVAAARPGVLLVRIVSGDIVATYGRAPLLVELPVPNATEFRAGAKVDAAWRRDNGTVLWIQPA